jgi:anaerobic C4-dicarboxylate transporter
MLGHKYLEPLVQWKEEQGLSYTYFHLLCAWVTHTVCQVGFNLIYWFLYHNEFAFFERYKAQIEEPWPWHEDLEGWRKLAKKATLVWLFNSHIVMCGFYLLVQSTPSHIEHNLALEDIPDVFTLTASLLFCMICEDVSFYIGHRFLH